MRFVKMHGLGNDFVVVERDALVEDDHAELARRLCARRTGIGADGLLVVGPRDADGAWPVGILNADGSRAGACGNGARCLARFLGLPAAVLRVEGGHVEVTWDGAMATARMRAPRLGRRALLALEPGETAVRRVDVGNAHAVVLGVDPAAIDLPRVAVLVRERFGDVNVGVVALAGRDALRLRVDERGVGETLACGTGACAAVAAARAEGYVGDRVVVELPGGALSVWLEGDSIVLGGPAAEVFRGEWAGGTGSARPAGE